MRRAITEVRAATAIAPARPAYAAGLRAALATVVPLAVDHVWRLGGGTWMSLAGFSGALADKGGPYRTRAATLATLTVGAAACVALGGLAGSHPNLAVPLTFVVAVAASLGRAYGNAGASVGITVLNAFVISLAYPAADLRDALLRGAFTVAGGLWAMALSLLIWPLRPYRPVRLAVGGAYRAVGTYAGEVARAVREGGAPGPVPVRTSLEAAHAALATVRRGRPGESGRGERLVVLGEGADQLYGHLFGLSDVVDTIGRATELQPARDALASTAEAVGATAFAIADAVESEDEAGSVPVPWRGDGVRSALAALPPEDPPDAARRHVEEAAALLDRAAQYAGVAAATVAGLNSGAPVSALDRPREVEDPEPPVPLWGPLRAALAPDSMILRFALRVGLVTAAAVALAAALDLRRGYWVTITAVIILQPYTGATTQRALQRVLGTLVGAALTAGLAALFHDPVAILVLAFVFSAVSVALLPLNYAAFSVFLTPTFVLLAEASAGDWHLAGLRIANTLIGGGLALAGTRLLWPSAEVERLPAHLGEMIRAMAGYLEAVVARFDDRSAEAGRVLLSARRRTGLAILNADESFQRLLGEQRGAGEEVAPVMTLLTYARRFTASVAALALSRHSVDAGPPAELIRFSTSVRGALADLADAVASGRAPAEWVDVVPADEGTSPLLQGRMTRVARQLKTLHDAVARWHAARAASDS